MEKIEELIAETERVKKIICKIGDEFVNLNNKYKIAIDVEDEFHVNIKNKIVFVGITSHATIYINGGTINSFLKNGNAKDINEVIIALRVLLDSYKKRLDKTVVQLVKEFKTIE